MQVDVGGTRAEELAFGPGGEDRGARRWPWLVVLVSLVVLATGLTVDERRRASEAEQLLRAIESSQATLTHAEQSVAATVIYSSPALVLSKTPEPVRADLVGLIEESAGEAAGAVRRAHERVVRVQVWPWHQELVQARQAYLGYLARREARFTATAEDIWTLVQIDERSADLLAAAGTALRAAVGPGSAGRVDELLAR